MIPSTSLHPAIAVDMSASLSAARYTLRKIASEGQFQEYLLRVLAKGPSNDLDRMERNGRSHFKILSVHGNGFEAPLGTFLVLSLPHEVIGVPGFEHHLELHVRHTGERDGFETTMVSKSEEFRTQLAHCSNASFLKLVIMDTFGR
jgi:hypothetical protein